MVDDDDEEDSDEEGYVTAAEDESEDESEEEEEEETPPSSDTPAESAAQPIPVTIKTHTNSKLLDQSIELPTVKRSRNIQSIKQSVSRQLPSRPPMEAIQILHEGQILDDETLIEDILDGLESAPQGLVGLLAGENRGKRMVRVAPDPQ